MDWLHAIDVWLFLKLNAGAANGVFDWFMPIATEVKYLLYIVAPSLAALVVFGGGKGRSMVLTALILVTITDQLSSHLLKPLVARERPCHTVELARVLYRCGKTWSFPSSHAVNAMGAAIFFGLIYRRYLWVFVTVAVINSYSRVYLGIHYPFDMLCGWLLGMLAAYGMVVVYRRWIMMVLGRWRFFRVTPYVSETGGQDVA
ncbi:MAG TPA: phosphatase PAP2 family protein [candidate division Zixibacteria bacterium]|nr:phosphatase PAP2 family protein [candidate division Zixibacteria bacterium]